MSLPAMVSSPIALAGVPDILPPGGHVATMEDIRERFVDHPGIPFPNERQTLFSLLEVYVELVWGIWDRAELWIDGGFVTHKGWAAPHDVDVAIVDTHGRIQARIDRALSLLTLDGAIVAGHQGARVQPFGGMIDGFAVAGLPQNRQYWETKWSGFLDKNRQPVSGVAKGFVKVVKP